MYFRKKAIMFADIAGFTAWSSEREPTQVFMLLERYVIVIYQTKRKCGKAYASSIQKKSDEPFFHRIANYTPSVYAQFDEISKKHGVFKVETVGDCYVAVSGLPDPRPDHAVVMAKVAQQCVYKMGILTKRLECVLGPDTGDLRIRIGLHR